MRKFFISLTNFILLFLLLIFTIIISIKDIAVNTIYNTTFTSIIKDSITNEYPEIKEINDDNIKSIIEKYVNMIANDEEVNITPEIEEIIREYNLSEEKKNEIVNRVNEHNDIIVKTIKEEYTPTEKQKFLLSVYNYLNSKTLKTILLISIIVLFVIMVILQKSLYEWMMRIGIDFLIVGASIVMILPSIITKLSSMKIDIISLTDLGSKYACIGLLLLVIYIIISIIVNKFSNKEEHN